MTRWTDQRTWPVTPGRFVGRQEEMNAVAELLAAAEHHRPAILAIVGESGMGKTALLAEIARCAPPGWSWSYLRLGDALDDNVARVAPAGLDLPGQIVHDLGGALLARVPRWRRRRVRRRFTKAVAGAAARMPAGPVTVTQSVSGTSTVSGSPITVVTASAAAHRAYREALLEAVVAVASAVSKRRGILLLDDADWLTFLDGAVLEQGGAVAGGGSGGVGPWFLHRVLQQLGRAAPRTVIVLSGRTRLELPQDTNTARVLELARLDEAQTKALLASWGIGDRLLARRVHEAFDGHPMWSTLAADALDRRDDGEIPLTGSRESARKWLLGTFFARLTAQQRVVLRAAAVGRFRITRDFLAHLLADHRLAEGWFEACTRHCFFKPLDDTGLRWELDRDVRSVLLEFLEDPDHGAVDGAPPLDELHERAAEYHARRGSFLDETYHRLALGDDRHCEEWRGRIQSAHADGRFAEVLAYTNLAIAPEQERRLAVHLVGTLAFALHRTADLARMARQSEAAYAGYLRAAALYGAASDVAGQAAVFEALGPVMHGRGDYRSAETYLARALVLHRAAGNGKGQATVLLTQGAHARQRGQAGRAEKLLRASLKRFEQAGDPMGECQALYELGNLRRQCGDLTRAGRLHQQALDISRSEGYPSGRANAMYALGGIAYERGRLDQAEHLERQALKIYQQLRDVSGQIGALHVLASVERGRDDMVQAVGYLRRALALCEGAGSREDEAGLRHELGIVALLNTDLATAQIHLTRARDLYEESEHRVGLCEALHALGTVARLRGQYEASEAFEKRALELSRAAGDLRGQAGATYELACLARARRELVLAESLLRRALALYRRIGHVAGEAQVQYEWGRLRLDRSEAEAAATHFERAAALFRSTSDTRNLAIVEGDLRGLARTDPRT